VDVLGQIFSPIGTRIGGEFLLQSRFFGPMNRSWKWPSCPTAASSWSAGIRTPCQAAGISLALGSESDGEPLVVRATIKALMDGKFTLSGPKGAGNPADPGPCALLRVVHGVRVVVVGRRMQAHDQEVSRHIAVEPAAQKIVAVKSTVHLRAHFQPMAEAVLMAAAPGPVAPDPATLSFTNLRVGIRLRPGDNRRFGAG